MTTVSGCQSVHRYAGAKSPAKRTDEAPDHKEDHGERNEIPSLPAAGRKRTNGRMTTVPSPPQPCP